VRRRLLLTLIPTVIFAFLLLGVSEAVATYREPTTAPQAPARVAEDRPWQLLPFSLSHPPTFTLFPAKPLVIDRRPPTPKIGFALHVPITTFQPLPKPLTPRSAELFDKWIFQIDERIVEEGGSIVYVTRYGNFTFSAANPAGPVTVRSFGALAGDLSLEARVQYWLLIDGEPAALETSRIVEKTRAALAYEAVFTRGENRLAVTVRWDFLIGAKTTIDVRRISGGGDFRVALASTIPEGNLDPDISLLREPPASLVPIGVRDRIIVKAGLTQYVVDWSDEPDGADPHAGALNGLSGIIVLFKTNHGHVDPATKAQVFGPTTVNIDFSTTGEKTLLTMSTTLQAGGQNVIVVSHVFNGAVNAGAGATWRIKKGATILYETKISNESVQGGGQRAKHVMIIAVDSSPSGNDSYTFTLNLTTTVSTSGASHVQGIVIKTGDAQWAYNTTAVSISAGATATVVSLSTSYPANSKVVALAFIYPYNTGSADALLGAGNVKLKLDTTVISSNQFSPGSYSSILPAHVNLEWFGNVSTSPQTWSVEVTNGSSYTFGAYAVIATFTVVDGAFLDTNSVALTNGSQVTVGSLSTTLIGDVAVIGLAAAENTSSTSVVFNANDVVLQKDNSSTNQISNLVCWYLEPSSYSGRSGIMPLFRVDTDVTNPSYQIKMTARASGINGEAKIVVFIVRLQVMAKYSLASGGNPVSGSITMRYVSDGATRILVLSTSYQSVLVDAGSSINVDFVSSGSNQYERWAYSGGGNYTTTVTSNLVLDLLYYDQLKVTLIPVTVSPYTAKTSSSNYASVTGKTFNANYQYSVWENGTSPSIWVDRGGNIAWSQTTSGSTSTHRWATAGSITLENIQSASTSSAYYYEQWLVTWQIALASGSTPLSSSNYAWARGKQFGGDLVLSPLVTTQTDWVDHNSTIWIATPTSGSTNTRRWINYGESFVVSSSGTYNFNVQEEVLVTLRIWDADHANVVRGTEGLVILMHNGSLSPTLTCTGGICPSLLQANVEHYVKSLWWRGYAVENGTADWSRFRAPFTPKSSEAGSTTDIVFPRIWAGLGGSDAEIWLRSQSVVTSVIWDSGRQVIYIQSEKTPGETYFYYGYMGKTPMYIYIDGVLFSDVGYEVDTVNQIIRISVGGGSLLFDFSGKTQPPPTTDISSLVQQLYAIVSRLTIQQPSAPAVSVPTIDLSFLRNIYASLAAAFDRISPVPSSIAFPGIFLIAVTGTIYYALTRARRQPAGPKGEPREVVVVRESPMKAGLLRWIASTLASTAVLAPLLYYVLPTLFPQHFERPAMDFRLFLFAVLAATAVAVVFVAIITIGVGRQRGELREA